MKKLIIINGPTAVGKSTIIALLHPKLKNYVFVDRAYMKQMLKPLSKKLRKELSTYISLVLITEAMKRKKNILTQEINSKHLIKYAKKYDYALKEFFLTCSLSVAFKRDKKRGTNTKIGTIRKIHKNVNNKIRNSAFSINTEQYNPQQTLKIIPKRILQKECLIE